MSEVHELKIYLALLEAEAISMEVLRLPGGGCRLTFAVSSPGSAEELRKRLMIEADDWGRELLSAAQKQSALSTKDLNCENPEILLLEAACRRFCGDSEEAPRICDALDALDIARAARGSSAKDNAAAVETESEFICANCERAVPSMDNCPHCGSIRTVLRSFWNGERLP